MERKMKLIKYFNENDIRPYRIYCNSDALLKNIFSKVNVVKSFIFFFVIGCLTSNVAYADCVYRSPSEQALGEIVKSFKVMTTNVFGQDVDGVVDFITTSDGTCQDRLREIGEHIRDVREPYDIVGLQEWHTDTAATCNGVVLKNRIDDLYPVSGVNVGEHTMDHYQWAHPKAYDQNDGGLGIISRTKFLWDPYSEDEFGSFTNERHTETENIHQFTPRFNNTGLLHGFSRTAHGFLFARIFLSRNPVIAVDTYVVHLTSTGSGKSKCNLQCKRGMLKQLREGIHKRSANSGYPVLVMGDFNIGGPLDTTDSSKPCVGSDGYRDIMTNLGNPKDLWLEKNPTLSKEEGYTHISGDARKKMRIDFMFVPSDPYLVNSRYEIIHKIPRKINHVQLSNSDHKSVIAELDIRKKPNVDLTNGLVTIQQKSTRRYLDAHEGSNNDFRLVTRPRQNNTTQSWRVTALGGDVFSLRQVSNSRFVDAHDSSSKDFSVVTRPNQNNDTQRWIIKPIGDSLFTIQQKSNSRFMDAYVDSGQDFKVVTRDAQSNDTQRWIIKPLPMVVGN